MEYKEKRHLDMFHIACEYRGLFIGYFVRIEHILADFCVQLNHKGDFEAYYSSTKTAGTVIRDFWKCFDSISHVISFSNRQEAEDILKGLLDTRNNLSHYMLLETQETIDNFDNDTIHLISYHLRQQRQVSYTRETITSACKEANLFLIHLIQFQQVLYKYLKIE